MPSTVINKIATSSANQCHSAYECSFQHNTSADHQANYIEWYDELLATTVWTPADDSEKQTYL